MKVCKYCDSESPDSAAACPSCGASEFSYKCRNCGTVFDGGKFCPQCGVKVGTRAKKCPRCGNEYYSAACPACGYTSTAKSAVPNANAVAQPVKKRKTWLWVLGWIFIFPIPLTILITRKQNLNTWVKIAIIAAAWIIYFAIGGSGGKTAPADSARTPAVAADVAANNIKELSFTNDDEITVKVGKSVSQGYLKVSVKSLSDFSPEDISFVSENPEIAEIAFSHDALTTSLYFDITGISGGETNVYAATADGSVKSGSIHVIVPEPVKAESIELTGYKNDLVIGEKTHIKAEVSPANTEDRVLTWTSSEESVASVDKEGNVVALGGGATTITAAASNGVSASAEINVDGAKTLMKLSVDYIRDDDVNIGNEWSYDFQLNGEYAAKNVSLAVGDKLSFYAEITENDAKPDIGSASLSHTVTEQDIANGFEKKMDVYVTENGGKNRGKRAHFIVTYTFSPSN